MNGAVTNDNDTKDNADRAADALRGIVCPRCGQYAAHPRPLRCERCGASLEDAA